LVLERVELNNSRVSVKDKDRDEMLAGMGWSIFRIACEENPSREELKKMFLDLPLNHD
jgi:very-short-patch-repair endonuclease